MMNRDPFRQAANRLNRAAPPGERVAYVNPAEENLMMAFGGSGRSVNGIPSYAPTMKDYGEATREALETQLAMVTGDKVGDTYYGDILPRGLKSIVEAERPGRLAAAQLDTDVLRKTLLGGETSEAINVGGNDEAFAAQIAEWQKEYDLNEAAYVKYGASGQGDHKAAALKGMEIYKKFIENAQDAQTRAQKLGETQWINPFTGNEAQEGEVFKSEGLLDLYGPKEAAMTTKEIGSEAEQFGQYVQRDGALLEHYEKHIAPTGESMADWGKRHYERHGKADHRELPAMGETYQVTRRAGFDPETGEFLGMTTYGADVSEQLARKQRAGDIYDVEQLGPRATEAYRQQGVEYDAAGNAIAGTGIAGTLAEARSLGPGGSRGLSAIPAVPLFSGGAEAGTLRGIAQELGAAAPTISGGRMGDFDPLREALPAEKKRGFLGIGQLTPREGTGPAFLQGTGLNFRGSSAAPRLAAQPAGGPVEVMRERPVSVEAPPAPSIAGAAPRQTRGDGSYSDDGGATWRSPMGEVVTQEDLTIGPAAAPPPTTTNRLRGAMLSQVQEGLGQGLTEREKRNLREASRARATAMGRTYDPTSTIDEVKIQLMEDEARRGRNLAQAQSILGGEAGIQQSDLARNLQAQMANLQTQQAGIGRELGAAESDVERAMRQQAMEEQYRQAGLGAERAAAASMVGLEQATSTDPLQAILGRPSGAGVGVGQQVMNTAQYGLGSAPSFITPQTGLGYISAENAAKASMYGAEQQAAAARSAGKKSMLGGLLGGALGMFDINIGG